MSPSRVGTVERIVADVLVTVGLLVWGSLTVAQQTTKGKPFVRRFDPTGAFIPVWTFFGPNPGTIDYELLVRDELFDGNVTDWSQVHIYSPRTVLHVFFEPTRRFSKSIFDAAQELHLAAENPQTKDSIHLSLPYVFLLDYVTKQVPHANDAAKTQFLVVSSPGIDIASETPTPTFVSHFHELQRIATE